MNRVFDRLPVIGGVIPGKITLSFLMLIFALSMQVIFPTIDRILCVFAMLFSFLGDVTLNYKKTDRKHASRDLVLGGILFVVAHMFYCNAYYLKIKANNYKLLNLGFLMAVVMICVMTCFFMSKLEHVKHPKLFLFGITYLLLTGVNYVTIFSYSYSARSIAAIGGVLFLASDIIIGFERFLDYRSPIARELVWWLYPAGQIILIAMA